MYLGSSAQLPPTVTTRPPTPALDTSPDPPPPTPVAPLFTDLLRGSRRRGVGSMGVGVGVGWVEVGVAGWGWGVSKVAGAEVVRCRGSAVVGVVDACGAVGWGASGVVGVRLVVDVVVVVVELAAAAGVGVTAAIAGDACVVVWCNR